MGVQGFLERDTYSDPEVKGLIDRSDDTITIIIWIGGYMRDKIGYPLFAPEINEDKVNADLIDNIICVAKKYVPIYKKDSLPGELSEEVAVKFCNDILRKVGKEKGSIADTIMLDEFKKRKKPANEFIVGFSGSELSSYYSKLPPRRLQTMVVILAHYQRTSDAAMMEIHAANDMERSKYLAEDHVKMDELIENLLLLNIPAENK